MDKIIDPNPVVCNKQGVLPTTMTKWAYYTVEEVKNKISVAEEWRGDMTVLLRCFLRLLKLTS